MNITEINADGTSEGLLKGILYGLMGLIIVCINAMVIISYFLRAKRNRGNPDIFVVSLAVSSILTGTTVVGLVAYVRASHNENFVGKKAECYVQYFFGTMLRLTDVATTTSIAFDRFTAVYIPIFYRNSVKLKHGYIACTVIWISSAFIASIPFILDQEISKDMESLCTADWTTEIAIVVVTVSYIQFLIVLICYIGIFKSIREFVKRQKEMLRPKTTNVASTLTKHKYMDTSNVDKVHDSRSIQESNREDWSSTSSVHRNSLELRKFPNVTMRINNRKPCGLSYINECFEGKTTDGLVNLSKANIKASYEKNKQTDRPCEIDKMTDGLVKLSQRNLSTHNVNPDISNIRTTDGLVQLSQKHFQQLFRDVDTPSQGVQNGSIFNEKDHKSYSSLSSSNLKLKKTTNQVSWSDLPESRSFKTAFSSTTQNNQYTLSKLSHVKIHPEKLSNEISPPDNITDIQPNKKASIQRKKVRRNLSTVVKDKWAARKIRRTSSIRSFWKESKTFAKIMGVVVLIFYISWLPLAVSINIVLVTGNQKEHHNILWICYNLSLLSSAAIPIAYAVMCKPYQRPYRLIWNFFKDCIVQKLKH